MTWFESLLMKMWLDIDCQERQREDSSSKSVIPAKSINKPLENNEHTCDTFPVYGRVARKQYDLVSKSIHEDVARY